MIATSFLFSFLLADGSERAVSAGSNSAAFAGASQFPSLVIAMGTTSYFLRSIASITARAERSETSCSPERPPKITPTRILFDIDISQCTPCLRGKFLASNKFTTETRRHGEEQTTKWFCLRPTRSTQRPVVPFDC